MKVTVKLILFQCLIYFLSYDMDMHGYIYDLNCDICCSVSDTGHICWEQRQRTSSSFLFADDPCLLTSSNVTSSLRWGDLEQPSVKHMERELAPRSLSRDSPLERAGLPSPAWSICGLQVRSEWSGTLTDVFARLLQWCGCCIGLLW